MCEVSMIQVRHVGSLILVMSYLFWRLLFLFNACAGCCKSVFIWTAREEGGMARRMELLTKHLRERKGPL